jgi:TolA-binding protein/predicted negative regulator of RcsB-dependent stress response
MALPGFSDVKFKYAKVLMALGLLLALAAPAPARGAEGEDKEYGVGTNEFADRQWLAAEATFRNFVAAFPASPHRADAILYLSRSRIELSNYAGALELLEREMPKGKLEPDFVYWMAWAFYGSGQYNHALERCDYLLGNLTADAPLPLRATLLKAHALAGLTNWSDVTALLSKPGGVFESAIQSGQSDGDMVDGYILLGQAYLAQHQDVLAEEAIGKIATDNLSLDMKWERQNLLCRILLEEGRLEDALAGGTNLLALSAQAGREQRIAAAFLRGEIFERNNRLAEALEAYSTNLEKSFPPEVKQRALSNSVDLMLRQVQPSNTMRWLDSFIQQRTNEPMLDMALFHLGDLQLKAYFAPRQTETNRATVSDTNLLASAITNLDRVIQGFPESEFAGKACLDRGWCDWEQGNFSNAATHFSAAALRLPLSENQAVALLKLGDACFRQDDYGAAVAHYNQLLTDYTNAPMASVTNGLFDLALYQLVQANIRLGNEEAARAAAEHILAWFPIGGYGEESLRLLGEDASSRKTNYPAARAVFQRLLDKYPGTPLWPEIQLAIARTYEQEGNWPIAFNIYTNLEASPAFATNALRPQLDFSLALACGKAALESNALVRMSNFVARFPADTNAALAQNWIGNYHMDHGNYLDADLAYQELCNLKKYPNPPAYLVWQARLMAGRAALAHEDLAGASNDFYSVRSDTNAPAALVAQARFQFGYTVFQQFQHEHTNESLLKTAINALSEVTTTNSSPTNTLTGLAYGQLGSCYLAWADLNKSTTNTSEYTNAIARAIQMFQSLLQDTNDSPVDVTARSQGEFGLGLIAERQNQPQEALRHYCNVLYDTDTRHADPAWVKDAGVKAAALFEAQKDWAGAEKVYRRIQEVVPSLGPEMQKNIDRVKAAAQSD